MKNTSPQTVIILSEVDWNYLWQRHQIFATLYARNGAKTYYINRLGMRFPKLKEAPYLLKRIALALSKNEQREVESLENLRALSPIFFPGNSKLAKVLNKIFFIPLFKRSIELKSPLLIHAYQPTQLTLDIIESFNADFIIYDCVQNFPEHPSADKNIVFYENALIDQANIVLADSKYLYERLIKLTDRLIRVPPGVSSSYFIESPPNTFHKSTLSILYYGNVRADLDFTLINQLADSVFFTVTIVGTIAPDCRELISHNVKILKQVPMSELPPIIARADALLLPYKVNDFTKGIIPAKFFECLASGKPIVATPLPEFKEYSEIIFLTNGADLEEIRDYINSMSSARYDKQISLARTASWEQRFESFWKRISSDE